VTATLVGRTLPSLQRPAFDAIADEYDRIFTDSVLGKAHRSLVHAAIRGHFRKGQRILDLNCGTGEDAICLASQGMSVVAGDISERMLAVARHKASRRTSGTPITFAICANEHLGNLERHAPFDGVLSNFGGFNCTADLTQVALALAQLVRPGGEVFLCLMGRVCVWEILWDVIHGCWSKAFRRLKSGGTRAIIGGTTLNIHYPSVREMRRAFAPSFHLASWRGIGVALPPPWMEPVLHRHSSVVDMLARVDRWLGILPVFRGLSDHILFRFVREGE
jgi:ubiquinone/menaquinone biosynthesis C-methylase UbiE